MDAAPDIADLERRLQELTRLNEQLVEAHRMVRDREELLDGIVQTAMDAIITIDSSLRVTVFNKAAAAMFRLGPSEAIGGPLDALIPPESRAVHREHLQALVRDEAAHAHRLASCVVSEHCDQRARSSRSRSPSRATARESACSSPPSFAT